MTRRRSPEFDRVIIPDFHGNHIDKKAALACIADVRRIRPREGIFLGDGLDCGGTFSTHQRSYTHEMCESFEDDKEAANWFLDALIDASPGTSWDYVEGNHEAHIERWASRMHQSHKDAVAYLERMGPEAALQLRHRNIPYYKRSEFYDGLSVPGTIRRGKCLFTHGFLHSKNATHAHLERMGMCVVHGHTHRAQSAIERTASSDGIGGFCPGTLAKLQPLYRHTAPTSWSHGYGYQHVLPSGRFLHINVPIVKGESLLLSAIDSLSRKRR